MSGVFRSKNYFLALGAVTAVVLLVRLLLNDTSIGKQYNLPVLGYEDVVCNKCVEDVYGVRCVVGYNPGPCIPDVECVVDSDCSGFTPTSTPTPTPTREPQQQLDCSGCRSDGRCIYYSHPCTDYLCEGDYDCRYPSPPPQNYRNCPVYAGMAWCTQTNPLWAEEPFPVCDNPDLNKLRRRACGQAVSCSVLCKYVDEKFCNLKECIESDKLLAQTSCSGTDPYYLQVTLNQPEYNDDFEAIEVKADKYWNLTYIPDEKGNNLVVKEITWEKIDQLLKTGSVMIAGFFKIKEYPNTNWIGHHSLIVKKDANSKRIYNDPYFNMDNTNEIYKIPSHYLEDYLDIVVTDAILVKPI